MGLGALKANACRLALAALVLGLWVWSRGWVDFSTRAVQWLLVSGVVGFGLGDICLFVAFRRIGARLTMLVSLCSAPVFGAALDWWLHGAGFTLGQAATSAVILTGVGMALLGGHGGEERWHAGSLAGVVIALCSGFGQGCGAALSRHAQAFAALDGTMLDGAAQAFIRTLSGMALSMVVWLVVSRMWPLVHGERSGGNPWGWLAAAVIFGPVLGVSCFQWALSLQGSVVVLSITATTPVLIMPLAARLDGDRPRRVAVFGALIAVLGVLVMLQLPPA